MDARTHTICSVNLHPDALSLIKSILTLRPETWTWTDAPELAQWWLVDADEPVETRTVVRSLDKTVLALVSSFASLPTPGWTFLAKPPRSHMVMRVLDHHLGAAGTIADPDLDWRDRRIRLLRWPNITRFSATPAFIHWCGEMLKRPVPYVQLVAALPVAQVRALLDDATRNAYLEATRHDTPVHAAPPATEPTRGGLWSRLWSKWGVHA